MISAEGVGSECLLSVTSLIKQGFGREGPWRVSGKYDDKLGTTVYSLYYMARRALSWYVDETDGCNKLLYSKVIKGDQSEQQIFNNAFRALGLDYDYYYTRRDNTAEIVMLFGEG